jgi:hypothetical protein
LFFSPVEVGFDEVESGFDLVDAGFLEDTTEGLAEQLFWHPFETRQCPDVDPQIFMRDKTFIYRNIWQGRRAKEMHIPIL